MSPQKTYKPEDVSVTFELQAADEVTTRFYMRRRHPSDGHVVIHDGENNMRPLTVHETDVDFVCAAMNVADRSEKLCTV